VIGAARPIVLPTLPMNFGQFSFSRSIVGPPRQMDEMLRFAAVHRVRPVVEVLLPFHRINQAL
jgi:alcohol/geraniol dehydrogenase (NADP+)